MTETTLILGSGPFARDLAGVVASAGRPVVLAGPENPAAATPAHWIQTDPGGGVDVVAVDRCLSCVGSVGQFSLVFSSAGGTVTRTAATLVLADAARWQANFPLYGLDPGNGAVSLTEMTEAVRSGPPAWLTAAKRCVFLLGVGAESHPAAAESTMTAALALQQNFGVQTYILTGNLKVAGSGMEALCRATKSAGTLWAKFTDALPEIRRAPSGAFDLTFLDEVTRETFRVHPDIVVVDETPVPSDFTADLSRVLRIHRGPDGFFQSGNVHREPVATNRRGVFVAGPARGVELGLPLLADAGSAALAVEKCRAKGPDPAAAKAEIDRGRCVRCLTCFRVCPHGAVVLDNRPVVHPEACEGCGICAAECPCLAIQLQPAPEGGPIQRPAGDFQAGGQTQFVPGIVAFCCSRSAQAAGEMARTLGCRLPPGLRMLTVPCAGSVSLEHLLSALQSGADGVAVLTCHPGNCFSEKGNTFAHDRVDQVIGLLPEIGFEPGRLVRCALAANMGVAFAETITAFEQTLVTLGPSRFGAV